MMRKKMLFPKVLVSISPFNLSLFQDRIMTHSQELLSFSYWHHGWEWVSWLLSLAKDLFLSILFLFIVKGSILVLGNRLSTYLLPSLFFALLICRRSVPKASFFAKEHRLFWVPGVCFIILDLLSSLDVLKTFYKPYENVFDLIACIIFIIIARAPLYYAKQSGLKVCRLSYKNTFLFFLLQMFYGGLFFYSGFYQIEKRSIFYEIIMPSHLKHYLHNSGVTFYYEREEIADRIASVLPDVMQTLKTSPLYSEDISFVLIERKNDSFKDDPLFSNTKTENAQGFHDPITGTCTYPASSEISLDEDKYFDINPDYRVVAHELTHHMVRVYCDKVYGFPTYNLFLPLWKNEGYAEYMATKGYYTKSDWLDILSENNVSDSLLEKPFDLAHIAFKHYTYKDYMAACIQTRYALDYKGISVFDFMKSSYKPASAGEIKAWLESE